MSYEIVEQMPSFKEVLERFSELGGHVGFIVFGPESLYKEAIYNRVLQFTGKVFGKKPQKQEYGDSWSRVDFVLAENGVIAKLNGYASSNASEIRNTSITMRQEHGMEYVVGIYVRGDRPREHFSEGAPSIRRYSPEGNGLDLLVTASTTNPSPLV